MYVDGSGLSLWPWFNVEVNTLINLGTSVAIFECRRVNKHLDLILVGLNEAESTIIIPGLMVPSMYIQFIELVNN